MALLKLRQSLLPWFRGDVKPQAVPAKVVVHAQATAANRALIAALRPSLQAYRYPSHMRSHIMSYWAVIRRPHPPEVTFQPFESVPLPDGGHLELHWAHPHYDPAKPLLLVIPGTRGHITSRYIEWAAYCGRQQGCNVVVAPLRGCGSSGVQTARCFDGAKFWDVAAVVEHLEVMRQERARQAGLATAAPFWGLGYSMGAGFLAHYVAEAGEACPLSAALCISGTTDYHAVVASLHRPSGWLYNLFLTTLVKQAFWRNRHIIFSSAAAARSEEEGGPVPEAAQAAPSRTRRGRSQAPAPSSHTHRLLSMPAPDPSKIKLWRVLTAFTVPQWHEAVTVHLQGASSSRHFCESVSFTHLLPRVSIPLLLVNAANDPICRAADIPVEVTTSNPNIVVIETDEGGHTGFVIADTQAVHPTGGAYAAALTWDNLLMDTYFKAVTSLGLRREGGHTQARPAATATSPRETGRSRKGKP